jgi:hypothetical protein
MRSLQKREKNYPVNLGENFIQDAIARHLGNIEPRRETSILSNIFSKRITNTFIRLKVYNNCTFYIGADGGG